MKKIICPLWRSLLAVVVVVSMILPSHAQRISFSLQFVGAELLGYYGDNLIVLQRMDTMLKYLNQERGAGIDSVVLQTGYLPGEVGAYLKPDVAQRRLRSMQEYLQLRTEYYKYGSYALYQHLVRYPELGSDPRELTCVAVQLYLHGIQPQSRFGQLFADLGGQQSSTSNDKNLAPVPESLVVPANERIVRPPFPSGSASRSGGGSGSYGGSVRSSSYGSGFASRSGGGSGSSGGSVRSSSYGSGSASRSGGGSGSSGGSVRSSSYGSASASRSGGGGSSSGGSVRSSHSGANQEETYALGFGTNLLYLGVLVPNLEAEFYFARRLSIRLQWMYANWGFSTTPQGDARFWGIDRYGGEFRYWFRNDRSFLGHAIGAYGNGGQFDVKKVGYDGHTGGYYGGGLSYGYTLSLNQSRSLVMGFGMQLGYMYLDYQDYTFRDGKFYHLANKTKTYWGPTGVEVTLTWRLGRL